RRIGDQEQPGFAQQGFRQIEEGRERAGAEGKGYRRDTAEDGVGEEGAAQECGRMDHDDSPLLEGSFWGRGQRCSSDRSRRISRIGQSALPTLFSIVCTCTNTKTPVSCTNGCGMFRERASNQVARLSVHGIAAATKRKRES